jgi:kynurenine formamidase
MSRLIDLTAPFYDGMPGFSMTGADGREVHCTAEIREVLSHADTAPLYGGKCAFAFTEARFFTSIGTRLDAPYVRYPEMRDIAGLTLEELVLPGVVVDARGRAPESVVAPDEVALADDLAGRAVLVNFGWDRLWGKPGYLDPPVISLDFVDLLIDRGAKLLGVDAVSVDGKVDPSKPAHSRLLARDILIVEDLCHLDRLHGHDFRFFALPIPARGAASMPVRAFAEILGDTGRGGS